MPLRKELILAFFAVLVLGIAFSGCVKKQPPVKTPEELISDCKKLSQEAQEACFLGLAGTGVENACIEIASAEKKDSCFQALATAKADANYCTSIISKTAKDNCYAPFFSNPQSTEDCLLIQETGLKNNCLLAIATATGTVGPCNKISTEALKENCFSSALSTAKNPEDCNVLKSIAERDDCILTAAVGSQNPEYCAKIGNVVKKDDCKYQIAKSQNSIEACGLIQNNQAKNNCINELALLQATSESCLLIQDQQIKDSCYTAFAVKATNAGLCAKIIETQARDSCISQIANALEKESECSKISVLAERNTCYYTLAARKTAVIICDKITSDQNLSDKCYSETAGSDASQCEKIAGTQLRDECLFNASKNSANTEFCNLISDIQKKISCSYQLAIQLLDEQLCVQITSLAKNQSERESIFAAGRDNCISEIARLKASKEICSLVYSQNNKPACYGFVAGATGDTSICKEFPAGALYQLNPFEKQDTCQYTFAKKTSSQEACAEIIGESLKKKCNCVFNSQDCTAIGNGLVNITVNSFDGNLASGINVTLFKSSGSYYSSFLTSELGTAIFDPVIEGNYMLIVSDNSGKFASAQEQINIILGSQISQTITLNESCYPSQIKNNYESSSCCYLGNVISDSYLLSATGSPDREKILCNEKTIYSCGNTACTFPTCIISADSQAVGSFTCNTATGWTISG